MLTSWRPRPSAGCFARLGRLPSAVRAWPLIWFSPSAFEECGVRGAPAWHLDVAGGHLSGRGDVLLGLLGRQDAVGVAEHGPGDALEPVAGGAEAGLAGQLLFGEGLGGAGLADVERRHADVLDGRRLGSAAGRALGDDRGAVRDRGEV